MVFVSSPFAEVLNKLGLAEPIDHAKVPNLANLYPEATQLQHDPGNTFSVPYTWGTTGLCYRSDLVKTEPTSWNDLLAARPTTSRARPPCWRPTAGCWPPACSPRAIRSTRPIRPSSTEVKDLLIEAKKTLLAYDDTTFYSKLVSGEALLVQAWDGWCNYGIAENTDIKYVDPEGRLRPLGRHDGGDEGVGEQGRRLQVHQLHARRQEPRLGGENILYKVPNKAAMESLPADLPRSTRTWACRSPSCQVRAAARRRRAQRDYSRIVSEIKAAQ